ncbi:hypothetical protein [Streptomyces sp. NPDC005507]|uniref:hypothetical protein n=1 Tax=Streptomyces sp. NPDC005507 TaxID=3154885 RepID=UPI0033A6E9F5
MPASATKRDALALTYARDGFALLEAAYDPRSPHWLRELPALQTLRVVLLQNYTRTVGRDGRPAVARRAKAEDGGDGLPPGHADRRPRPVAVGAPRARSGRPHAASGEDAHGRLLLR